MIEDFLNKVVCGDCLEVMKGLPDESVDCVITDPPYGYSFMGKDWDKAVPSVAIWRECLRVLKPGAFAFVMSAPRQDVLSQMIVRLGEAGFNTGFTSLYWTYSSGFPKAGNIGKMVDKRQGHEKDRGYLEKSTGGLGGGSGNTVGCFTGKQLNNVPYCEDAKRLDGSFAGFQPKPAVEIVIVVMKPLSEKTYVEQALKNGKGITWLNDGRIPYQSNADKEGVESFFKLRYNDAPTYSGSYVNREGGLSDGGRFPANLLVADDVLNDGSITKSSKAIIKGGFGAGVNTFGAGVNTFGAGCITSERGFDDSGGFSRYFSLDAWWDKRVEGLPREVLEVFPFLIVPKASKGEKNEGCDRLEEKQKWKNGGGGTGITEREEIMSKNHHPTVKPLKLFSYLITIGSREHDLVLDPFAGSGTIGVAARIASRNFIGIELQEEYCKIGNARIAPVMAQKKLYEV